MDWGGGSDKDEPELNVGPYGRMIVLMWVTGAAALMLWAVLDLILRTVRGT